MIRKLILLIFGAIVIIVAISLYLPKDDLSSCGKLPGINVGCQSVDAIVAISGGDTSARTNEAIDLYKAGWANILIFSGGALDKTGPSNASEMERLAIQSGVPAASIYIDEKAESTRENAENTQPIFTKLGINKIIIVTSGYHQRRAGLEFEKYTSGVTILNHPAEVDKDWSFWWWLAPHDWWLAGSEIVKIIVFSFVGA